MLLELQAAKPGFEKTGARDCGVRIDQE